MAGSRDAGSPVDVGAHVTFLGHVRRSGVDAHAHPDRPQGKRLLRLPRRIERPGRGRKSDEEGVALGVNLDSAVTRRGLSHCAAVLRKGIGVRLGPHLVQQLRRALDIGEQERHRACREVASAHLTPKIVARPPRSYTG